MVKTFNFGKVDYKGNGRKENLITVEIELKDNNDKQIFSASGMIWNRLKTDCLCGGQCLDVIAEYIKTPLFNKIYRLWKLYHLNDLHAGTPEQEIAVNNWLAVGNKYDYIKVCEFLKSINLFTVDLNGEQYSYGHKWLYQAIPENDLQEIKNLLSRQ